METSSLIVTYERKKIFDFVGDEKAKIAFSTEFPNAANFKLGYTQFFITGLYQVIGGPTVLVLPWFMQDEKQLQNITNSNTSFLDVINKIHVLKSQSIDLAKNESNAIAQDFIIHSYLTKLIDVVTHLLNFNYQNNSEEELPVIRGKWHVEKNLSKGDRPSKFYCSYNSIDKNSSELVFIKSFCNYFSRMTNSKKNYHLLTVLQKLLVDVHSVRFDRTLLKRTVLHVSKKSIYFNDLIEIIEFADSLCFSNSINKKNAGFAFTIPMDKFFENLISRFLSLSSANIKEQIREDLLGGAYWNNESDAGELKDKNRATQITIPDVIVKTSNFVGILDCKYKPLQIPFINTEDTSTDLKKFSRDDRNQILSFVLSVRPSFDLRNKKLFFAIIFPSSFVKTYKVARLTFESTNIYVDSLVKNISQNISKNETTNSLSIKFVAVNINHLIEVIRTRNQVAVSNFLEALSGIKSQNILETPEANLISLSQKRVLLSALAVKHSGNTQSLGQVKMAKILYLADSHLNLKLNGNYERHPYGPLDPKMIYEQINLIGEKNAIFKFIKTKKFQKYVPSINLDAAALKAERIFSDKLVNLHKLFALILPLDTEQAEIVSTLYACWNDLIADNKFITDELIINEFIENWHESKKKSYSARTDRLRKALSWMKANGLIPDGQFKKTIQNKRAAGF